MKTVKALTVAVAAGLVLAGCGSSPGGPSSGAVPPGPGDSTQGKRHGYAARNVILMVGDGMGTAQRDAIRLATVGLTGELAMDSLPHEGRAHTNSVDPETFVTDSAAAATAMATGVKTYNGAIGVGPDGSAVPTALEVADQLGKATGLVTTSQVTDATPAAFGAHVADRSEQSEIARQFLAGSAPEVILGGGEDHWYPAGDPGRYPDNPAEDPSEESGGTAGNLVEQAQSQGYEYVWDLPGLSQATGERLLGLFANEEMFQYGEGIEDAYSPTVPLTDMTAKALEILSAADGGNESGTSSGPQGWRGRHDGGNGFFLMVEEEGIDAMAHVNNAGLTMQAGGEFDRSVALAREFAELDGNTLLIVVGDHETGGMTIESLDDPQEPDESGDGASAEDGPFTVAGSDQQFLVDWTTGGHSALDVPLTAYGPGAQLLTGVYENTAIFDVMTQVMRAGAAPGWGQGRG